MVLSQHTVWHANVRLRRSFYDCVWRLAWYGICLLSLPIKTMAAELNPEESRLKVALLYNFSQYVDWPEAAFADPTAAFIICVLGDERITQMLTPIQRRHHRTRPIKIKSLTNLEEARTCHILYLDKDGSGSIDYVPDKALGESAVLTISNDVKALESGFAIAFSFQEERVGLNMNMAAVRKAKLKVSAKLVEIANRVVGEVGR